MVKLFAASDHLVNDDSVLYRLINLANPSTGYELDEENIVLSNWRPNKTEPDIPYNTLVDVIPESRSGLSGSVTFGYDRLDLAKYIFPETGTIGYLDAPMSFDAAAYDRHNGLLEPNHESSKVIGEVEVKRLFWNLLTGVRLLEEVTAYDTDNQPVQVLCWECSIGLDNRVLQFTLLDDQGNRIYKDSFICYTYKSTTQRVGNEHGILVSRSQALAGVNDG